MRKGQNEDSAWSSLGWSGVFVYSAATACSLFRLFEYGFRAFCSVLLTVLKLLNPTLGPR